MTMSFAVKRGLYNAGIARAEAFCKANNIPLPDITAVPEDEWCVSACAYYRPNPIGIRMCLARCSFPSGPVRSRNWNWPGSTTDREPYGVIAHELGHHADWLKGHNKGQYWSEYSTSVFQESGEEPPITSYCDNYAEWFAEMFRLFVTNHALLKLLRPRTYETLLKRGWIPASRDNWRMELAGVIGGVSMNPPPHIISNLEKKIAESPPRMSVKQKRELADKHKFFTE